MVCLGLSTKNAWFGLGKDHTLSWNSYVQSRNVQSFTNVTYLHFKQITLDSSYHRTNPNCPMTQTFLFLFFFLCFLLSSLYWIRGVLQEGTYSHLQQGHWPGSCIDVLGVRMGWSKDRYYKKDYFIWSQIYWKQFSTVNHVEYGIRITKLKLKIWWDVTLASKNEKSPLPSAWFVCSGPL